MLLTTKEQADIVVAAQKYVRDIIRWQHRSSAWRLEVRVGTDEKLEFLVGRNFEIEIVGNIGRRNYGFSLLFNKTVLRRYDCCTPHTNPDGSKSRHFHKHYWTPEYGDAWTYTPSDIDPDSTIDAQFEAFCRECNVELRGGYQRVLLDRGTV